VGQRVLITGIAGYLAGRLARRLEEDPEVDEIVGVDLMEPRIDLERTEFVRADIRNPLIVKVLQTTAVDTVVHLNILSAPAGAGGRSQMKEINVIGTMQLFAACQRAEKLRKVVMKSSTAVYGAGARNPAMFTEEMSARSELRGGYSKDAADVEQYARTLARRRPDVALTTLRFANFMGPQIHSALTRYFSLPVVPTPLGFDPRLEFVHEDDADEVLYRMTRGNVPGIFNVSADGAVYLSQALRLIGRPALPILVPLARPLSSVVRRLGLVDFPEDQLSLLLHGRVTDSARLKRELDWSPRFTSRESLLDFGRSRRVQRFAEPEQLSGWEEDVQAFLRRKGQENFEKTRSP
jgi:UDP-glucose 4-epimerase